MTIQEIKWASRIGMDYDGEEKPPKLPSNLLNLDADARKVTDADEEVGRRSDVTQSLVCTAAHHGFTGRSSSSTLSIRPQQDVQG